MNQSKAKRLIPKLKYNLHERRNLKNPEGPQGRHNKIRKTVTALFKYERIEMNYHRADESRGYAERLISDAIRYGDCHQPTMEMATYWLLEKQMVHKLFKVLVPRYQNFGLSYTKLWKAPNVYPGHGRPKCVLELRNNIFPSLGEDKSFNKNLIHNVLLLAAKKAFEKQKAEEIAQESTIREEQTNIENVKSQIEVTEELNADAPIDCNTVSNEINMSDKQSEKSIRTESVHKSENENDTVSSIEKDLNKLEISEVKPEDSPSQKEEK